MTERSLDDVLDELRPALRAGIADLAEQLLGPPSKTGIREWRWGSKGSFRVTVSGPKQGACANFEDGWKGDPIGFIQQVRRTDFIGAVAYGCQFAGIAFDGEGRQEEPAERVAREAERDRKRAEDEAAQEADEGKRIAFARLLWDASTPLTGTVAETYLTVTRAIPRPATGWPDAVRYHSPSKSLIVAGTDSEGVVRFVQRVRLTADGRKAAGQAKNTDGVMAGAFVRLPGEPDGPLLLAEGPETGLSAWVATGHESRLSIGALSRHNPPQGRRVVICGDDDPQQSPADRALKRAISRWIGTGAAPVVATPWSVRRHDKSDFNDLIQARGVDAVRARVAAALEPPHKPIFRMTVEDGRIALQAGVDGFYDTARGYDAARARAESQAKAVLTADAPFAYEVLESRRAWADARAASLEARRLAKAHPPSSECVANARAAARASRDHALIASEIAAEFKSETQKIQRNILKEAKERGRVAAGPFPVHGIKVDVGAGKSEISLGNIVRLIPRMRATGDKRTIVIAIPAHKLGDQQVKRFGAMPGAEGLKAAVWRSRKAKIEDRPMCLDLDAVADAEEALADVQTSVCRQVMPDGSIRECPFFAECPFQQQRTMKPDVWFVAHELLFGQKPEIIGTPAIVVVDESAWQDGLFGTGNPIRLLLDTLTSESANVPGEPFATGQLKSTRASMFTALSKAMDGMSENATLIHATRSEMIANGIDVSSAGEAYASEWKRKIEADIYPGMPGKSRKEAVEAVVHNKVVAKLGMLWKAVANLVADDGPERSGWISVGLSKTTEGTAPAIHIKGRRDVHPSWHVPTLILDATMQPDLVRPFWPTMELTADIRLQTPHQHVVQVIGRSYSKVQLGKPSGLRNVHAIICREVRRYAPGRVLVVLQQEFEEKLPGIGPLPANTELGHHNAIAGRDEWGPGSDRAGVVALIVVGRTAPSPNAVESMAEALTGAAIEPIPAWYEKGDAAREMADGTFRLAETDRHPHPIAEAIRWQIVEGELIQIIGRPRGVNRTAANPVDILIMTNAPIPVPVERLISAADLTPSPADLMMATGGGAFDSSTDAATAYPNLWRTTNAAQLAFAAAGWPGGEGQKRGAFRAFVIRDSLLRKDGMLGENVPHLVETRYQLAGPGRTPSVVWTDPTIVSDPAEWLTERLGPLAWCGAPPEPESKPDVLHQMADAGLLIGGSHAWRVYGERLFSNPDTAKKSITRAAAKLKADFGSVEAAPLMVTLVCEVQYRPTGAGTRSASVYTTPETFDDLRNRLSDALGGLAEFLVWRHPIMGDNKVNDPKPLFYVMTGIFMLGDGPMKAVRSVIENWTQEDSEAAHDTPVDLLADVNATEEIAGALPPDAQRAIEEMVAAITDWNADHPRPDVDDRIAAALTAHKAKQPPG